MNEQKYCPLCSVGEAHPKTCLGGRCAWWDARFRCCIIKTLAWPVEANRKYIPDPIPTMPIEK